MDIVRTKLMLVTIGTYSKIPCSPKGSQKILLGSSLALRKMQMFTRTSWPLVTASYSSSKFDLFWDKCFSNWQNQWFHHWPCPLNWSIQGPKSVVKIFFILLFFLSVTWNHIYYCVRGTKMQPLICVGCSVHYWVSCTINKGGFFEIAFSLSTHICLTLMC